MTVLNLMLGKKRGGLEQAALDYAEALAAAHIKALTVISPKAWVEAPLVASNMQHESLPNLAAWDPFAARRLRAMAAKMQARAVICHGNRALTLALRALKGTIPVIAVAHNYKTKRFAAANACFAITQHLAKHLLQEGAKNITLMPNMVRLHDMAQRPAFRSPPRVGTLGRFVQKKGFEVFIEALAILKSRDISFRAVIGGDGELRAKYEALLLQHKLQQNVTLTGWVKDKNLFFDEMDIFVLPSHHEPFGIVLIEAMAQALPVIATASEGPSEIIHHGIDGILTPKGDAAALADAIAAQISNQAVAQSMGKTARSLVEREYTMNAMAGRLKSALTPYLGVTHA